MARPAPARPAALPSRCEGCSAQPRCRSRRAPATRSSGQCAAAWVGGRSRIAASLSEARNRWRVAATRAARRAAAKWHSLRRRPSAPRRNQRGAWRLLLGHGEGKFAVADAPGKSLGETRRCLLAVGRDEFGKGGKQARLRQAIPIYAVDARVGPGRVEVAERSPFLLMVRSLSRNLDHLRCHADVDSGLPLRGGTLAREPRAPRRNWSNG